MAQKTTDRLTSVSLPSMLFLITPNHVPTTNGTYMMYRLKIYQMMFLSLNSNMMGDTSGTGLLTSRAPEFTPLVFSGVRVARSLVFCVLCC
jgi:hypothetical protein